MTPVDQMALSVALRDDASFENFYSADGAHIVRLLSCEPTPFIYLWGESGCGCSHLLQSACHLADQSGDSNVYFPLHDLIDYGTDILDGLESVDLVVLDDIDVIAKRHDWQEALFHLFNALQLRGGRLLVGAKQAPAALEVALPDLASRLASGVVLRVPHLSDEQLCEALKLRSKQRGLILEDEVAAFILRRSSRSTHDVFALLERLDQASLSAQRKLTIPFVKHTLAW